MRYGEWERAVRTIDRLQVIQGFYQRGDENSGGFTKPGKYQETPDAPLMNRKEKQNEVNIAVEMMLDALHSGNPRPGRVYLLSEDSDLMPVVFALEERLHPRIPVTILLPSQAEDSQDWCKRYRETRERLLACLPGRGTQRQASPGSPCQAHVLTKEILAQSLLRYTLQDKTSEFLCRPEWQLTARFLKEYCPRAEWRPVPTA